jgi:hypothetical protein
VAACRASDLRPFYHPLGYPLPYAYVAGVEMASERRRIDAAENHPGDFFISDLKKKKNCHENV